MEGNSLDNMPSDQSAKREPSAENPYRLLDLKLTKVEKWAAGVPAVMAIVSYQIPERNTVTYFPEANVLVSINNVVKESNMPASKYVKIKIKRHDPARK